MSDQLGFDGPNTYSEGEERSMVPRTIAQPPAGVDPIPWLERRIGLLDRVRPLMVKATIPMDWVRQASKRGETFYLQATGVDRIGPFVGLWFSAPEVTEVRGENGAYTVRVKGDVRSELFGIELLGVEGARSSTDPFFARQAGGFDQEDVRKAAFNNWRARAASMLLGLRGITADFLARAGLDPATVPSVEYKDKGGSAPASGGKPAPNGDTISEAQGKRLWAIANARSEAIGGIDPKKIIRDSMDECGYKGVESSREIKRADYNNLVAYVEQYEALP